MILIASIFHTGTFFMMDVIPFARGNPMDEPKPNLKYQIHLTESCVGRRMQQCKTIVPLRHPDSVATSWATRGLDLKELERQWDRMTRLTNVFFFPIDAIDKEKRLNLLADWLGVPLRTNWRPVNSCARPPVAATIRSDRAFNQRFWQ